MNRNYRNYRNYRSYLTNHLTRLSHLIHSIHSIHLILTNRWSPMNRRSPNSRTCRWYRTTPPHHWFRRSHWIQLPGCRHPVRTLLRYSSPSRFRSLSVHQVQLCPGSSGAFVYLVFGQSSSLFRYRVLGESRAIGKGSLVRPSLPKI